jgi:hypothetical protein
MSAKDKNKKDNPLYLVVTPIDELIDEGLSFQGDTAKDVMVNTFDFSRIREIIQRFGQQLTGDQNETLIRALKCCVIDTQAK